MQHGDLSSDLPKRILAVWEDTLAFVPDPAVALEALARRIGRHKRAVRYWLEKDMARGRLWQASSRYGVRIEVATFLGDGFADALSERLDTEGWPVSGYVLTYANPGVLGRELAGRRDILSVYDLDPKRALHYGSRAGGL